MRQSGNSAATHRPTAECPGIVFCAVPVGSADLLDRCIWRSRHEMGVLLWNELGTWGLQPLTVHPRAVQKSNLESISFFHGPPAPKRSIASGGLFTPLDSHRVPPLAAGPLELPAIHPAPCAIPGSTLRSDGYILYPSHGIDQPSYDPIIVLVGTCHCHLCPRLSSPSAIL